MKMLRIVLIFVGGFIIGFLVCIFYNRTAINPTFPTGISLNPIIEQTTGKAPLKPIITYVEYKDGEFHPKVAEVEIGRFLSVINKSKTDLMWLVSDLPELNTVRGYGETEEQKVLLNHEGSYTFKDKLNPTAVGKVIIVGVN